MELLQLKYFQTAANLQNFSKAADELNISQPSLSMTISHLEGELNTKLFDRKGRNIILNEAGYALLERVNNIFIEVDNAKKEIAEINNQHSKQISLITTGSLLLSGILKEYLLLNPDIIINQKCDIYENIERQLSSGYIDFALTMPIIKSRNFECRILKEDEIVLVVPKGHRLFGEESVSLSELSEEPFIALDKSYSFRNITDNLCRSAGFSPNIIFEVDIALIKDILALGKGLALLPKYLVDRPHAEEHSLSMVKIKNPDSHMQIGLSWRKNKHFSEASKNFRDFIINNYKV